MIFILTNNDKRIMKTIITPLQLTDEECRYYLLQMDREGADFWMTATKDLQGALNDNLRDFGDAEFQDVILTTDNGSLKNLQLPEGRL